MNEMEESGPDKLVILIGLILMAAGVIILFMTYRSYEAAVNVPFLGYFAASNPNYYIEGAVGLFFTAFGLFITFVAISDGHGEEEPNAY